ncbi:MAG: acyl-CoA-binding protein, partial [bacterium]|nr:acyl-CoA-binding protein [bacterium]
MSLKDDFTKAQKDIKTLDSLDNTNLLKLYSLYKQATKGDVSGKRPGMLDMVGRAKFDAWAKLEGMSEND